MCQGCVWIQVQTLLWSLGLAGDGPVGSLEDGSRLNRGMWGSSISQGTPEGEGRSEGELGPDQR